MMAATKTCFKCGIEKPIDKFYKHPQMADGHLGKCKVCTKLDVSNNYASKREQYAEYERKRFQNPERKEAALESQRRRRRKFPEKASAYATVSYAVKNGRLERQPCEICGDTQSQAHHSDYSKPLDVRWLCFKHHRELHGQVVTQSQGS